MRKTLPLVTALVISALVLGGMAPVFGSDAPRITKEALLKDMNDNAVIVIDVRRGPDWNDSDKKIKGAVRQEPGEEKDWAGKYEKGKKIVLYCD